MFEPKKFNHKKVWNRNYAKLKIAITNFRNFITICAFYTKIGGKTYHAQAPHGSTFKNLRRLKMSSRLFCDGKIKCQEA
jgi:hypothetical protein